MPLNTFNQTKKKSTKIFEIKRLKMLQKITLFKLKIFYSKFMSSNFLSLSLMNLLNRGSKANS